MLELYSRLAERALRDEPPSESEALWILDGDDVALLPLLHAARVPRERHFGRKVMVHVLNNVQNGLCPEDCGYCSQSRDSKSAIRKYPIKSEEEILAGAEAAAQRRRHPLLHGDVRTRSDDRARAPARRDHPRGQVSATRSRSASPSASSARSRRASWPTPGSTA